MAKRDRPNANGSKDYDTFKDVRTIRTFPGENPLDTPEMRDLAARTKSVLWTPFQQDIITSGEAIAALNKFGLKAVSKAERARAALAEQGPLELEISEALGMPAPVGVSRVSGFVVRLLFTDETIERLTNGYTIVHEKGIQTSLRTSLTVAKSASLEGAMDFADGFMSEVPDGFKITFGPPLSEREQEASIFQSTLAQIGVSTSLTL